MSASVSFKNIPVPLQNIIFSCLTLEEQRRTTRVSKEFQIVSDRNELRALQTAVDHSDLIQQLRQHAIAYPSPGVEMLMALGPRVLLTLPTVGSDSIYSPSELMVRQRLPMGYLISQGTIRLEVRLSHPKATGYLTFDLSKELIKITQYLPTR